MPKFKIDFSNTERGFARGEFLDLYGNKCSVQSSSLATEEAIWVGMDEGVHHMGKCMARMHLNRKQARALINVLQKFVDTGELK